MFASQTQGSGQPSKDSPKPRRRVNPAARWLVAFGALLFLLLTPEPSHACANRADRLSNTPHLAVTHATRWAIASSHGAAAVISSRSACCGEKKSHHCGGSQAGSCCPACTAGLFVTDYVFFPKLPPLADFFPPEINFSPAPLDEQFRPPRTAL